MYLKGEQTKVLGIGFDFLLDTIIYILVDFSCFIFKILK